MLEQITHNNSNQDPQSVAMSWQNLKWQSFISRLEIAIGKEVFDKWLTKLDLYSLSEYEVIMSAPSKFLRDWIKREYLPFIKELLLGEISTLQKFSIICIESQPEIVQKNGDQSESNNISNLSKYDNVFAFGTELNPKFTFENFIAGDSNQLVFKAAKVMAGEHNQTVCIADINPLFLYGGVGLGKTHLGQAIAWYSKDNNKKK